MNEIDNVIKIKLNLNGAYCCLKQIKKNLMDVEAGEYSYDRCFNNILELTDIALEHIAKEL